MSPVSGSYLCGDFLSGTLLRACRSGIYPTCHGSLTRSDRPTCPDHLTYDRSDTCRGLADLVAYTMACRRNLAPPGRPVLFRARTGLLLPKERKRDPDRGLQMSTTPAKTMIQGYFPKKRHFHPFPACKIAGLQQPLFRPRSFRPWTCVSPPRCRIWRFSGMGVFFTTENPARVPAGADRARLGIRPR